MLLVRKHASKNSNLKLNSGNNEHDTMQMLAKSKKRFECCVINVSVDYPEFDGFTDQYHKVYRVEQINWDNFCIIDP